jgi:hypothetical protein
LAQVPAASREDVPAGTMTVARSPDALRCPLRSNALSTLIRRRHPKPSCGGHGPTAKRTMDPARMIAESLTPSPGIREQHRLKADPFRSCRLKSSSHMGRSCSAIGRALAWVAPVLGRAPVCPGRSPLGSSGPFPSTSERAGSLGGVPQDAHAREEGVRKCSSAATGGQSVEDFCCGVGAERALIRMILPCC